MALDRYRNDPPIRGGKLRKSATAVMRIRQAMREGSLSLRVIVIKEAERLDVLAGREYGDARLWWVIAATSNIGWPLQVPPGTRLAVPTDLSQIAALI
jgi:hypothetical protein